MGVDDANEFSWNAPACPGTSGLEGQGVSRLPDDFRAFLRVANGGEGPAGVDQYLVLWPAEKLDEYNDIPSGCGALRFRRRRGGVRLRPGCSGKASSTRAIRRNEPRSRHCGRPDVFRILDRHGIGSGVTCESKGTVRTVLYRQSFWRTSRCTARHPAFVFLVERCFPAGRMASFRELTNEGRG